MSEQQALWRRNCGLVLLHIRAASCAVNQLGVDDASNIFREHLDALVLLPEIKDGVKRLWSSILRPQLYRDRLLPAIAVIETVFQMTEFEKFNPNGFCKLSNECAEDPHSVSLHIALFIDFL